MGFKVRFIVKVNARSGPSINDSITGSIKEDTIVKCSAILIGDDGRIWVSFIGNSLHLRYSCIKDKDGSLYIDEESWNKIA